MRPLELPFDIAIVGAAVRLDAQAAEGHSCCLVRKRCCAEKCVLTEPTSRKASYRECWWSQGVVATPLLSERRYALCRGRSRSHAIAAGPQKTALNRLSS